VLAVEGYAKAFKDIEPKKIKCNNLQEKLKKSEEQLNQLRENFEKIKQVINNLNENLARAKSDMDGYTKQTQQLQIKLERAEKLINGLASTKEGWQDRKKKYEEKYGNLIGDALMSAAFLSYAGPFPSEYREIFVKDELIGFIKQVKIPFSKDFTFPEFLVKPVEFIKWQLKGLPDDQFSRENGVLVRKGRMFPLLIDPQQQGNKWLKEMEREQNKDKLIIIDPQTDQYMNLIVNSANTGKVVILQNLEEDVDVALESMLNKAIKKPEGGYRLFTAEKELKCMDTFRLYMTSKLPNPRFKAEVTTKVTLVNFTVKEKGLEEQLNSVVIRKMEGQLENNKNELIKNKSENE
jgi:dynein heavy chain